MNLALIGGLIVLTAVAVLGYADMRGSIKSVDTAKADRSEVQSLREMVIEIRADTKANNEMLKSLARSRNRDGNP